MSESQEQSQPQPLTTFPAWWYNTERNNKVELQLAATSLEHKRVHNYNVYVKQERGQWSVYYGHSWRGEHKRKLEALHRATKLISTNATFVDQQTNGTLPLFV